MTDITPVREIAEAISEAEDRKRMSSGIAACMARVNDFGSELVAKLSGLTMVPDARQLLEDKLTARFAESDLGRPSSAYEDAELIIGSGVHAAIYAAVRAQTGKPKVYVVDRAPARYIGGTFAMSDAPVFRLNSENRPGRRDVPEENFSLNYLPGGILQPGSMLAGDFSYNIDLRLPVRLMLAQYATVIPDTTVTAVDPDYDFGIARAVINGSGYNFKRVIDARGLGDPVNPGDGKVVLDFPQFMRKMGNPFPLQGVNRVAVQGDGDSALCALEALMGISVPSMSSLDYVSKVDWYAPRVSVFDSFRTETRARYLALARYVEQDRINVINTRATASTGFNGAVVGGQFYDLAVNCTGFSLPSLGFDYENVEGDSLARRTGQVCQVGPACDFPWSDEERRRSFSAQNANRVAIFRYGPRTAALAAQLD